MSIKLQDIVHIGGFQVQVILFGDARPDCKKAALGTYDR